MRSVFKRKSVDGAVMAPESVIPFDLKDSVARVGHEDHKDVAWQTVVPAGVRVELELRTSADGEVYVESFRVSDVLDRDHDAGDPADSGQAVDSPVGLLSSGFPPVSEDADGFIGAGDNDAGDDGDDDASPQAHGSDATGYAPWSEYAARILKLPDNRFVRLTLTGGAA